MRIALVEGPPALIIASPIRSDTGKLQSLHARGQGAYYTTLTPLISGRPARSLANRFEALVGQLAGELPPDYAIAYDAAKALHAVAKEKASMALERNGLDRAPTQPGHGGR